MATTHSEQKLLQDYEAQFRGSLNMHQRAKSSLAGGIAHDGRFMKPFPLYIDHAQGAYKWDVDEHRMIDYAIGHGALILGHGDPDVLEAVHRQLDRGTHYGSSHELEVTWAEQIQRMVSSAELIRFTSSGTEANLLAMRIARAFSGKPTMLKFEGHFHGWSDYLVKGEKPPFENASVPGVPDEVARTVAVLPDTDLGAVEERLVQGDIGAVLVEPSGASWSTIPLEEDFLRGLRDLTTKHGVMLIFDEVITGFRWAPGGAQELYGLEPDMTTLAKIVAGGMPGGAITGRADIMEHLIFKDDPVWNATKKVIHPGTYNSNPIAATAGYACISKCANPEVQKTCNDLARDLRVGMNTVLENRSLPGCVWGETSVFHIILGEECTNRTAGDLRFPEGIPGHVLKASGKAGMGIPVTLAMALEGVDLFSAGGMLSVAHTPEDVAYTIEAFDKALTRLDNDGLFN